jgi:hypothetical protein
MQLYKLHWKKGFWTMLSQLAAQSEILIGGGGGGGGDGDECLGLPFPLIHLLRFNPLEAEGATKKLKEDKARKVIKLDVFMAGGLLFW